MKRARVTHQLVDAHPAGKIVLFRQIANAREHADGIRDRIAAEHSHAPLLGPQEPEDVTNQRRLAGAVRADKAVHTAARNQQVDGGQRLPRSETARQIRNHDHRFSGGHWIVV